MLIIYHFLSLGISVRMVSLHHATYTEPVVKEVSRVQRG